ncbi:hypothetical protein B9Z55_010892 [Caenorhabditis nigoni]|uniref:Uncharacterized protein n=1 Tax=Caenorhabditis nigoni TaxID=1611254 RepID=A0A2G5UIQ1_9PELO|nr:hypothetical protein B9Z55_010886 [Caenorhabditis nigoni]PIC39086.1 hypothetical protein B9Z55_010892 [Caenorhabditis nigoni]
MHQGSTSRRASCPQESASLIFTHSLAHHLMRSTEMCSTEPAAKEFTNRQAGADKLSHNSMLSRPFVSASLTSLATDHLSSFPQSVFHPAAMQDGRSLPLLLPVPIH